VEDYPDLDLEFGIGERIAEYAEENEDAVA
jgi:hypothetical protein